MKRNRADGDDDELPQQDDQSNVSDEKSCPLKTDELVCEICMVKGKAREDMYEKNKCSHTYCLTCIGKHIEVKIQENKTCISCPNLKCKSALEPEFCQSLVSKELFDIWMDALVMELAKEENWRSCPSCMTLVDKTDGCLRITCSCGFKFCYACEASWTDAHRDCEGDSP
ncbi:hypothetical protein FRX31_008614 [Thalictrum thalictroides]|uniref:RBR-type E3 ubiquitin transferase n=1 Tax=Thalictrum thalictroides TaxID=46969 RepID=A0A7J6WWJ8_THATH|nr:hypothetical protein FRX31_008614 [Thalictrum thalictroides]